jgi:hypothetical protein
VQCREFESASAVVGAQINGERVGVGGR